MYLKESESIQDMITFIGASQCTIDLINVTIYKTIKNKANRVSNCEVANLDKTVNASLKQRQDIAFIDEKAGIENLPENLRETAFLRMEQPDASLKELGEMHEKPIGRSGVNHRLKKISEIAESLRNGGH
jgi:hypothetical protein